MSTLLSSQIRRLFLDFFAHHDHTVVPSSALIPAGDPTLMFTNAGMVQFKDVFVGIDERSYQRATTSQKCMRVSGKHNDLEEVGRTARHHTFFEMLGNFSFGDYFKEQAIVLAWQFVTREAGISPDRLWVTVFGGAEGFAADEEARQIWRKVSGLPEDRILGLGMKDNFWAMGDTGPCGPCSEIHFDLGGDGPPSLTDFETGRIVEIWNNVFMQFDRRTDGTVVPLPKPSVDTGMGLERLCAVLQGQRSNYHTDLFLPLIETIAELAGKSYGRSETEEDVSMRVIADHARATAFLVADGLQPANEGRGYVMRRIMRRAIRHGRRLGLNDRFLAPVCLKVVDVMEESYPELRESRSFIEKVAENEERSFRRTLEAGLRLLATDIEQAKQSAQTTVPGSAVFKLYDTYGFPRDLTETIARENGLTIDHDGFEREMAAQQERSRGSDVGDRAVAEKYKTLANRLGPTDFVGYPHESDRKNRSGEWRTIEVDDEEILQTKTVITALLQNGNEVDRAEPGSVEVVLQPTPFYGESGGQIGDRGVIQRDDAAWCRIADTVKPVAELSVCRGTLISGQLHIGDTVWAGYESRHRRQTRAHHSATHLLHAALRQVLGDHVKQQGSLVEPSRLRFDYAHFEAPSPEQLAAVEAEANARVASAFPIRTEVLPFEQAKQRGAIALFGEKYGDTVRVVSMGASQELCGGTHTQNTGDIETVLITHEEAVASGVRRVEAEVAAAARARTERNAQLLEQVAIILNDSTASPSLDDPTLTSVQRTRDHARALRAQLIDLDIQPSAPLAKVAGPQRPSAEENGSALARQLRDQWQAVVQIANSRGQETQLLRERWADRDDTGLLSGLADLIDATRADERRLAEAQKAQLTSAAGDLLDGTREIDGIQVLATRVDGLDGKALRTLADRLRDRLQSGVLCLGGQTNGKATLLIAVTRDLTARFHAGELIRELAPLIGGRGGGKPELAQAGGSQPDGLGDVFERLSTLVANG